MKCVVMDLHIGKELIISSGIYVIESFSGISNVHLRNISNSVCVTYTRNELAQLAVNGNLTDTTAPIPDFNAKTSYLKLDHLKPDQRNRVLSRVRYVNDALDLYPIGPKNKLLQNRISDTARRIDDCSPPSPHSVYRWLSRYVKSGYNTSSLAQDAHVKRTRKSRLPENVHDLLREELMNALTAAKGATVHGVYNKVMEKVAMKLGYTSFMSIRKSETLVRSMGGNGSIDIGSGK